MDFSIIAKLRKDANITQEVLANKLGVTPQSVSKWELNVTTPDISLLPKIADIFGITIDYLLDYKRSATMTDNFEFTPIQNGEAYAVSQGAKKPIGYLIIPSEYNGKPVKVLGDLRAFGQCDRLTSVTVPNGVKRINSGAFWQCAALTSVMLPGSIACIDAGAFQECRTLTNITLPDGPSHIGWTAFCGCEQLTGITIPVSVTEIGGMVFAGCKKLKQINYRGTTAQWKKINKDKIWKSNCNAALAFDYAGE